MNSIVIRPLEKQDIKTVAAMEVAAWHEYYSQYADLYEVIRDSVTLEGQIKEWHNFISADEADNKMITGDDRRAFVALIDDEPVGIGAVSAYTYGVETLKPVDDYLQNEDESCPKIAKYQNLYVHQDHRGKRIGAHLNIARADYMLDKGYTGMYIAPYADATKTMAYHTKNGLEKIHEYMSISTYRNGKRAKIACMLNLDLQAMRDGWAKKLSF
jgi:GNAT superfamily N-acetyltransferase